MSRKSWGRISRGVLVAALIGAGSFRCVPLASKQTAGGKETMSAASLLAPAATGFPSEVPTEIEGVRDMFKQPALLLSAAVLALGVAACGGGSSSSSAAGGGGATSSATGGATSSAATSSSAAAGTGTSAGSGTSSAAAGGSASSNLSIAANPGGSLAYDKKTLSAKAGKVTITMTNMSPVGHNITIQQGTNGAVLGATPTFQGGTKSVTLSLKAGKYTFYCSVPGHRAAGMVGTLTVS